MSKCETCKQPHPEHDLRPYGKGGALICFKCAMASPEAKAESDRRMKAALTQGGPVTLAPTGPRKSTEAEIELLAAQIVGKKLDS